MNRSALMTAQRERDRTYITLLPSLALCSISLLTPSWMDAIAYY
jgi:hypothetical protein